MFENGNTPNWTAELFKIVRIQVNNSFMYLLEIIEDQKIKGGFYETVLQKKTENIDDYLAMKVLQGKGDQLKVRWLGYKKSDDGWKDANKKL